jgi:hypothetical protein
LISGSLRSPGCGLGLWCSIARLLHSCCTLGLLLRLSLDFPVLNFEWYANLDEGLHHPYPRSFLWVKLRRSALLGSIFFQIIVIEICIPSSLLGTGWWHFHIVVRIFLAKVDFHKLDRREADP